jgi:alpha-tubulin suppressor-like RCC1 family protein
MVKYWLPTFMAMAMLTACNQVQIPPDSGSIPTSINSFGADPSPVPYNVPVIFSWSVTGTDLTCSVDVNNDGAAEYTVQNCSSSSRAAHVYGVEGNFTAQLTVAGADGQTLRRSTSIATGPENRPPAVLGVEVSQGSWPNAVRFSWTVFDDGGSTLRCKLDADGDGSWDYDRYCNGTTDSSAQVSPAGVTSSFTEIELPTGIYTSIFEVRDAYSATSARTKIRNPVNRVPQIKTLTATTSPNLIGKIRFSVSDPDRDKMQCLLKVQSIGDFSYSNCSSISRTYKFAQPGTYTVQLEVFDEYRGVATQTVSLVFNSIQIEPMVSTGSSHTCAITSSGQAYCWGFNYYGQLGTGQFDSFADSPTTPRAVVGGLTFHSIATGNDHSCGLTTGGSTYCWGKNGFGELGNGNTTDQNTPQLVAGFTFVQLTAGDGHTCGRTAAGQVYCWGDNSSGQLGIGNTDNKTTPQLISGYTFTEVAAGNITTCGVVTGGAAYCWGFGDDGQIGNGTPTQTNATPQLISGSNLFRQLTVSEHVCGLTTADDTYCWGDNAYGQLGLGNDEDDEDTYTYFTPQLLPGSSFTQLEVGSQHTCGLTSSGQAWCWGRNNRGQLGTDNNTNAFTPQAVSGGLSFQQIDAAAGSSHTCAVTTLNEVYCWGLNVIGQLGVGDTTNRDIPTRVNLP